MGGIGLSVTFGSLVGFVAYGWLIHNAPVSLFSTYAYVNPVGSFSGLAVGRRGVERAHRGGKRNYRRVGDTNKLRKASFDSERDATSRA